MGGGALQHPGSPRERCGRAFAKESICPKLFVLMALASFFAPPQSALAEMEVDWTAQFSGQGGWLNSEFKLAPLSTVGLPMFNNPSSIGRFYGRLDVVPSYAFGNGRAGLKIGLYSNLNSAYGKRRGIVPIDRVNRELTRIKKATPLDFDKLLIFYKNHLGRAELGWSAGVNHNLKVTAPLNWGLGSVGGDFPYFFDNPQDVGYISLSAFGSANTSPRIAFYSPSYHGIKFGLSYQPDTRNTGLKVDFGSKEFGIDGRRVLATNAPLDARLDVVTPTSSFEGFTAGFSNVFEATVKTDHTIGKLGLKTSLGGITGSAIASPSGQGFNDLLSFQAGMQLIYGPISIGGGFSWAGRSGYAKMAHWRQRQNQYSIHGGVQYVWQKWTFGAAAFNSDDAGDPTERSDRQLWVYSTGLRYKHDDRVEFSLELDRVSTLSADYGDHVTYAAFGQIKVRFGENNSSVDTTK